MKREEMPGFVNALCAEDQERMKGVEAKEKRNMKQDLPYLSIHRVAKTVNLHPGTILSLIKKGDFPGGYKVKEEGILRFDPKEVARWMREKEEII